MRRLILLVLLAIASPVWVLVRVSFGYKLLITLFISNALLGAYAYYVMERNVFEIPGLVPAQEVPPLLAIYVGSLFLWAVQIVFFITRRLAVLTNTLPAPDPWSAGGFALGRPGSGAFDIPATMAVLGGTYFFVISPDTVWSDVDMALAIIISSAFLVTVYVARTNENTLPLLPLLQVTVTEPVSGPVPSLMVWEPPCASVAEEAV
ncbi:MAG: hypothetical protein AAFR98_12850, partial [Pseudomonadota bacterium]